MRTDSVWIVSPVSIRLARNEKLGNIRNNASFNIITKNMLSTRFLLI